jgi:DNA-binding NarL/FixJ family response regulator
LLSVTPLEGGGAVAAHVEITAEKWMGGEPDRERRRDELDMAAERCMRRGNPYSLTFREFTVLELLANGDPDKEIARQLGISSFTASKHVSDVLGKMGVASRREAGVRALREGLLD